MEKDIEKKLIDGVRKIGGVAFKFVSPGNSGVPDREIVLGGGRIIFVELKTESGRLSRLQKAQIKRLTRLGVEVWVLWGERDVERFLSYLREGGDDGIQAARLSDTGARFYN